MNAVVKQTAALQPKPLMGAPCKYSQAEILAKTEEYMKNYESMGRKIPSVHGLAVYLGIDRRTIYQWVTDGNTELSHMLNYMKDLQAEKTLDNGLDGTFNPTICKLVLSKHGYHDNADKSGTSVNVTINRGSVQVETQGQTIDVETE